MIKKNKPIHLIKADKKDFNFIIKSLKKWAKTNGFEVHTIKDLK